ncbi:Uncharacterized protein DBV15_01392 [Temnothorax longispinosus]|uniref:Calponin-homology (CH) domain-containing protein n=1 Tax=Temnothorax longispinosus TaxID=300112 RepID=A0A4S2KZL9_9HYME|nr:Uncharacterized protein DBV15_01392 [Temnothorax longispinosus]
MQTILSTNELTTGIRYDDVYISPSHIKFDEAFEGVTYRQRIVIKNIGYKPAFIRIRQLNFIAFQVKALKSGIRISPGLSITTYVTYTFKRTSISHAIIPIEINGKIFDYHVISTLAIEYISIEPKLIDFGTIDIGYSSGLKIVTIRNEGSKSTRFAIDLGQNDLDLMIKPLRGRIKPQKEIKLQVELMGVNEGTFYSEFWIKSTPNIRVPIKVRVIVPKLVVYHTNTTGDFTLIDFPPTDIDHKQYLTYSVFEIHPLEGRINPFQGIIFEIKFSPINTLQRRKEHEQKQLSKCENECPSLMKNRDFMQFIRIARVHCTESEDITRIEPVKDIAMDNSLSQRIYIQESMMEISSMLMSRASSTDSGICDVIKLCLYGEVEAVQLHFEPDTLYFGDLIVGQISQRVLRLTNPSAVAPIYLECAPNAAARCCPNWTRLKPKTSIEVLVKVCGKESIEPSFKLFFNVAADSYDSTASRRRFGRIKVGSYFVECTVNIIFKSKKGLLSKKSLPTKIIDDDEEIMNRLLRSPKWKLLYKDYSEVISRFAGNVRSPFKKSISTTKAAVLIPLSPLQIYKVHIYPTTFAFGMVAPNSFNYRRLVVKNTNDVPVMIRLISLSTKSIYFPENHLMILQPGSIMTRLVEYFADGVGKFNGYINYVINDNHSFELNITAYIVQKQLYIDKREIEFGKEWSEGEVYRPLASVVRITNKLDAKICFRWEVPAASGFHIEPRSGSVRGNATLHVYVRYEHSDNAKDNYAQALMKCESGSRVSLRLSVPRFVPKVEFVSDNANLGEIPLNLPTRVVAVLQNFEFNEVYLTFDVCCRFTTTIAVTIQGCLQLLYRINGSVSFPRLKLLPQRIDVKRLSIDALQTYQITATNVGTTLLKLQVLLEEHPEFHVSLLENGKSLEIANESNNLIAIYIFDKQKGTEGIIIVPGASQTLYLHFQPVDLASYAFYLPIVINQLLGPVSMLNPKSIRPAEFLKSHEAHYAHLPGFAITPLPDKLPTISIDYTVASRVIFFSKLSFRFNAATNKLSEELFIENRATSKEIAMSINIEEFNKADCPFAIERSHGAEIRRTLDSIECTLRPGGSVSFVLEFKPRRRGSFNAESELLESRLSITSHFNDQSRSFVDKTTDSKLHWNKERNDNGIGNENIQVDGKRTVNDNGKRVSIRKRPSALSMAFGTRDRKFSDRLLHLSYPASDRKDDYEKHMGRIMTIMEEWMYSGPLKFCFYPNIPYGITAAFSYFHMKKRSYMLHNAICLVTAWRKIRLGFIITPMQLVNPNQVQILMLVVHLFQVLPTYVPRAKINSVWQTSVNDRLVVEWTAQGECICSNQRSGVRDNCPFNVSLPVPSCNVQLRKCVAQMFQKTLESKERLFWSKYLNTHIELRLIKWLMGDDVDSAALEFVHVFNTAVTYKVTISDKLSPLILPECFTIQGNNILVWRTYRSVLGFGERDKGKME